MAKFYLDTSIWRDYYENRSDNLRPIGEWAFAFLGKCLQEKSTILYSAFVEKELSIDYSPQDISVIFEIMGLQIEKVPIQGKQMSEARALSDKRRVAFGDALHAVLARDNTAILITRDKHFLELTDVVEIKKPEDLL